MPFFTSLLLFVLPCTRPLNQCLFSSLLFFSLLFSSLLSSSLLSSSLLFSPLLTSYNICDGLPVGVVYSAPNSHLQTLNFQLWNVKCISGQPASVLTVTSVDANGEVSMSGGTCINCEKQIYLLFLFPYHNITHFLPLLMNIFDSSHASLYMSIINYTDSW